MPDEHIHPRAAVFIVALEVIAVPERQRLPVAVEDLEDSHIGVVDGNIVAFLEREAVELVCGVEDAILQHAIQFEVRLDFGFVEIELRLANLIGVEIPIPGLQTEPAVL